MTKLPSGNYRERLYIGEVNGKKIYKSFTAPTQKEVKLLVAQYQVETQRHKEDHPTITVAEALERYITVKEAVLSPSTIREYDRAQRAYFESLSDIDVQKLTSYDIQQAIALWSMNLSPKTVRNIYSLLMAALEMAAPERRFKVTLPQKKVIRRTVPTDEQIKRLLKAASPKMRTAIILGAFSLRRGEVCALKYRDVNADMRMIYVHADMVNNKDGKWVYKDIPKTSSSVRSIRVTQEVISLIGKGEPDAYVFPSTPNSLTARFTKLRNSLGLDVSFHSLRRYCASLLHSLGIPDKYIQQVGGWRSPDVMRTCYENVLQDKNIEFTKKMGSYYSEAFSDSLSDGLKEA